MAHDVFISYSSKDENMVRAISNALESEKIRCWYASRDIDVGSNWASSIVEAIKESKAFLLVFTDDSNASGQVMNEVHLALDNGLTVIPFKLTKNAPKDGMAYFLANVHWLDAVDTPEEEAIQKLVSRVKRTLSSLDSPECDNFQIPASAESIIPHEPASPGNNITKKQIPKANHKQMLWKIIIPVFVFFLLAVVFLKTGVVHYLNNNGDVSNVKPGAKSDDSVATIESQESADPSESNLKPSSELPIPATPQVKNIKIDTLMESDTEKSSAASVFFNKNIRRDQIQSVTFQSNMNGAPPYTWDVSVDGDNSVVAWVAENNTGLYDLFIAAEGGIATPKDCRGMFSGYSQMESINFGNSIYTGKTEIFAELFSDCISLKKLDLSGFDTSKATDMSMMFTECSSLESLDIRNFSTTNVKNMYMMFCDCHNLTDLDIKSFRTAEVTDMRFMFAGCTNLSSLNLSGFNTSNVTDMRYMFSGCSSLTSLDLSMFNTSKVSEMCAMFAKCSGLTSLDLSSFNTARANSMDFMFYECSSLTSLDISGFNTARVMYMNCMFAECSSLKHLNISGLNTVEVINMNSMFFDCSNLRSLDVSEFNTIKVSDMSGMFSNCSNLKSLDVRSFNTKNVTDMSGMFWGCSGLESLDISRFDTSNVTNMTNMFFGCSNLKSLDVSGFRTPKVTDMSSMFADCTSLTTINFGENFITTGVINMSHMFDNCLQLDSVTIDYILDNFDFSNVTESDSFMPTSLTKKMHNYSPLSNR